MCTPPPSMDVVFASEDAKAARKKAREENAAQKNKEKAKKEKAKKEKSQKMKEKSKKTKEKSKKTLAKKRKREVPARKPRKEKVVQAAALPSWTCGYCGQGEISAGLVVGCDGCDGWFHGSCLKKRDEVIIAGVPFSCSECQRVKAGGRVRKKRKRFGS